MVCTGLLVELGETETGIDFASAAAHCRRRSATNLGRSRKPWSAIGDSASAISSCRTSSRYEAVYHREGKITDVPDPNARCSDCRVDLFGLGSSCGCCGVLVLSERRAAFVSAVTHELRTPLTTFRMYAEMLSTGIVSEEGQRQQYTETLRVEADRLSHLVENVLQYAQLERGRPGNRREPIGVGKMVSRVETRLIDRGKQASMNVVIEMDGEASDLEVRTDPAAVEQILFNLVDNATKYAVSALDKRIHIRVVEEKYGVAIRVRDHGPGITAQSRGRLFQPFSKSVEDAASSAPGVGLGLALCRRLARQLGASLELEDDNGDGASFCLYLPK
jgi:signal transduction histidine kinase